MKNLEARLKRTINSKSKQLSKEWDHRDDMVHSLQVLLRLITLNQLISWMVLFLNQYLLVDSQKFLGRIMTVTLAANIV